MVDSEREMDKSKYDTDRLAQSSYGYSDEQLLEWLEMAEAEISDSQIPLASAQEYKRLEMERKWRERMLHIENGSSSFKTMLKIATAMAIIGSVLVLTGTLSETKHGSKYSDKGRANSIPYVVMNDEGVNEIEDVFTQ